MGFDFCSWEVVKIENRIIYHKCLQHHFKGKIMCAGFNAFSINTYLLTSPPSLPSSRSPYRPTYLPTYLFTYLPIYLMFV